MSTAHKKRLKQRFKNNLNAIIIKTLKQWFGKKPNAFNETQPRILCVCPTGLGDNIWSTPLFIAIKKQYPQAYIGYLTSPVGAAILQHDPNIDALYDISKQSKWQLWRKLRSQQFQTVYVLHISQRYVLPLACLLNAEKVIGIANKVKGQEALLDVCIPNPADEHVVDTRMKGLARLNITITQKPRLSLCWSKTDWQSSQHFLQTHLIPSRPIVILQIGASTTCRRWQLEKFIKLGHWLQTKHGCAILVAGGPKERNDVETVSQQIPDSTAFYGQLSLSVYTALISQAKLMVTADTGPMHIASATNIAIVALFGCCNDKKSGPYNDGVKRIIKLPLEICQQPGMGNAVKMICYDEVQKQVNNCYRKLA